MKLVLFSFLFIIVTFIIGVFFMHPFSSNAHLDRLRNKCETINGRVNNINNGGCGLFALYVTDYLDSVQIPYQVVYVKRSNDNDSIPNHVAVKIDQNNIYVEKNGLMKKSWMRVFGSHMSYHTKEELRKIVYQPGWNPMFNRDDTVQIKYLLFNETIR